jgi:5-methylcytosine-specific restriction endonuclease McrA
MSRAWQSGSTRAWRKVRTLVLARDGRRCRLKLPGCTTIATTVHHTLGKAHPAGDDPAHLVAACQHCNGSVGDPSSVDPPVQARTAWR